MDTKTLQELFDRVPDRNKPVEPTLVDYTIEWTLNRLKERDYQYLEVILFKEVAYEVVKALRANLEPKGYRVSIRLAEGAFYRVTIE